MMHSVQTSLLQPVQFTQHASYSCASGYTGATGMVRAEDLEMAAHASISAPLRDTSQPMSLEDIEAILTSSSMAPAPSSDNLGGALDDLAARCDPPPVFF